MLAMLLKDPVVWSSLLLIGVLCAMAGYYTYLFIHNSSEEEKDVPPRLVEALWRQMIGWFIQYEEEKLDEKQSNE